MIAVICRETVMRGYLYVLSNRAMPGLLKIGYTTRTLDERIRELSSTGVPTKFELEFYCIVDNVHLFESAIHHKLQQCRFQKQFFGCRTLRGRLPEIYLANRRRNWSQDGFGHHGSLPYWVRASD